MGFSVTERVIKLLCGKSIFEKGLAYYQSGSVDIIDIEERNESIPDLPRSRYEALVQGGIGYEVMVVIDIDGDVTAECTCPAYTHGGPFCKHIAAVLISIDALETAGERPAHTGTSSLSTIEDTGVLTPRNVTDSTRDMGGRSRDQHLVSSLLGMFSNHKPRPSGTGAFVDNRIPLNVEFICKPFTYSYSTTMLGIEMKIGSKRLYVVHKIRGFLERVHRGETFEFSKHFVYDPAIHSFRKEDNIVLQKLIEIVLNEKMYRDNVTNYSPYGGNLGEIASWLSLLFSGRRFSPHFQRFRRYICNKKRCCTKAFICLMKHRPLALRSNKPKAKATIWIFKDWSRSQFWKITGSCCLKVSC